MKNFHKRGLRDCELLQLTAAGGGGSTLVRLNLKAIAERSESWMTSLRALYRTTASSRSPS